MKILTAELIDIYRTKLYEYNRVIRKWGLILKPVHIVIAKGRTYLYYGKYWYRLEKQGSKLRWVYVGKSKPLKELPDPPTNPLSIVAMRSEGGLSCLCIREEGMDEHTLTTAVRELLKYLKSLALRHGVKCSL